MTGTSAPQSKEALAPVALPAEPDSPFIDGEDFWSDQKPMCSPLYDDILYVTGQRRFWLIPKRLKEKLDEASTTLREKVAIKADRAERMSSIADAGLLDYFLTPGPESFLDASDDAPDGRRRYLEAKEAITQEREAQEKAREAWKEARSKGDFDTAARKERELFHSQQRSAELEQRITELETIAYRRAEELGYIRENGTFYTPRALQARDAVDRYISERNKALAHGFEMFDPGNRKVATAWEHLRDYKTLHQTLIQRGEVDSRTLLGVRRNILELEGLMAPYINAIVELAECGIAVAEFALSPDDQYQGTEDFQAYIKHLQKRASLETKIEDRYHEWTSATAENAAPPGMLFSDLQAQWYKLNDEADEIRSKAELRVRSLLPPRMLLWEPERYQPKPLERLAKTNIPLREFSLSSVSSALTHLSLKDLTRQGAGLLNEALTDLKALPKPIAKQADTDAAFSDWLALEGAMSLDEKGPWFDEAGLFQPKPFFEALDAQGIRVKSLQDGSIKQRWGKTLQAMIFEDSQLRSLMLFDNSPQAQMLRCLLPEGAKLHQSATLEGPQWNGGPQLASVETNIEVAAWRGEVTLFDLQLPIRETAQPIRLDYQAHEGSLRTFEFGKLSASLVAKAWGFAGASLVLARELSLDQQTGYSSLSGVDTAKGSAELAKFDLFVGAQAGCKLSGELQWCPPPSVLPPPPVPGRANPQGWRTLAKLDLQAAVAVSLQGKGKFNLSAKNGRFILTLEASLVWGAGAKGAASLEIGYESVIALLDLLHRERAANSYRDLEWVEGDAMHLIRQLSLFGALGMDVAMLYLTNTIRGYGLLKGLYQSLTSGGRGGQIAYTLMRHEQPEVLRQWVCNLTPDALGPLLLTLISPPKSFTPEGQSKSLSWDQVSLLQQEAIERCLGWIRGKANASQAFEEALICMNREGARSTEAGKAYCIGRYELNRFMEKKVMPDITINNEMRARYRQHLEFLGARLNSHCEYDYSYQTFVAPGSVSIAPIPRVKYRGPKLD